MMLFGYSGSKVHNINMKIFHGYVQDQAFSIISISLCISYVQVNESIIDDQYKGVGDLPLSFRPECEGEATNQTNSRVSPEDNNSCMY